MDELLTAKDVTRILKISPMTLYTWMKAGKIRSYKIGYTRRFKQKDVERLIRSGRE